MANSAPEVTSLRARVLQGAAWMATLRFGDRAIGLVSTLILVRLLAPSDFGIVAMASVILAALELMAAWGFDVALIQDQAATRREYNTAWTLNVLLGLGSAVALALLAWPATIFYGEPRLTPVFLVLACGRLVRGFENIGLVDFRKHLDFNKEFLFRIAIRIARFLVTVPLAFYLRSYWALVIGIVASRCISTTASFLAHPFRPRFSLSAASKILGFSKWLLANNVIYFLRFRSTDLVVGKVVGSAGLGLYSVAYEIANLVTTELVAPMNRALLPGFAKISDDLARVRQAFVRAASLIAMLPLPAGVGIAAAAEIFTPTVLGPAWSEAIPLMEILALAGAIMAMLSPVGTTMVAIGRPRLPATIALINASIMMPAMILGTIYYGVVGAAGSLLLVAIIAAPIYYTVLTRLIRLSLADLSQIFSRPLVASCVMYLAVKRFAGSLPPGASNVEMGLYLGITVLLGVVVYAAVLLGLWMLASRPEGGESFLLELVKERLQRSRRRSRDISDSDEMTTEK